MPHDSRASTSPQLRLVGGGETVITPALLNTMAALDDARTRAVIRENRLAARSPMSPDDPRWILAQRAFAQMQGATMPPERRHRIMKTAQQLGVRPFDANLVIAIVQDKARRGESLDAAQSSLQLVSTTDQHHHNMQAMVRWLLALTSAAIVALLAIEWIMN
jgi:hypothetical protein